MDNEELARGNMGFMIKATHKIGFDQGELNHCLRNASRERQEQLYYGLQPDSGYIVIDSLSSDRISDSMQINSNLWPEFMKKVLRGKKENFPKEDCSIVEIPFKGEPYEDFLISLQIFGYTLGSESFAPVANPLKVPAGTHLERMAHLGLKIKPSFDSDRSLEEQQYIFDTLQKNWKEKYLRLT